MNKLTRSTASASLGLLLLAVSSTSYALDRQVEVALVKVCKSAITDKPISMKNAMDNYNLNTRDVALNVMCNGQDIISFAESYGANKVASRLERSVGGVSITDVAQLNKVNVTFAL